MAENNNYLRDAFGKSSDWIELQNTTGRPVNLDGWSLTDNISLPAKWVIPSVTLPPWGTLLIWASGSDLRDPAGELHTNFSLSKSGEYLGLYDADRTLVYDFGGAFPPQYENITYGTAFTVLTNSAVLVSNTSPVRAHCPPSAALGTTWRQLAFDDSTWAAGILPAGYATKNPAWLPQINFSLQGMAQGKPGVYLRIPFALDDASAVTALTYGMSYDDGAAVFINGTHACSANAPDVAALTYSSYSVAILNDPATLSPSNITAAATALADGPNLIEYYTGADPLDPTDRGRSALSCGHTPGTGLSVSFTQALDRPDARATLHASEDLLEWTELDTSVLESEQDGNARRWTLRLSPQAQSDYPRRYFRLRVWPATSSGGNGDT